MAPSNNVCPESSVVHSHDSCGSLLGAGLLLLKVVNWPFEDKGRHTVRAAWRQMLFFIPSEQRSARPGLHLCCDSDCNLDNRMKVSGSCSQSDCCHSDRGENGGGGSSYLL